MPALIDLRRRIRSVRNTQQVTKAMKTVATAKFKKAQRTVLEGRPHWHAAPALITRLARRAGEAAHPLLAAREERRLDVVVFTSDKGLCEVFNSNLLARTMDFAARKSAAATPRFFLFGKKAVNAFRRLPYPVEKAVSENTDKLSEAALRQAGRELVRRFLYLESDAVYLAHNEFKSVLAPQVAVVRLLPLGGEDVPMTGDADDRLDWEPTALELMSSVLPRFVEDQVLHAYAESQAAEQAARMMAMDSASKNAEDLIARLTLLLNKARQAGITKELLEIMTAVEALKS